MSNWPLDSHRNIEVIGSRPVGRGRPRPLFRIVAPLPIVLRSKPPRNPVVFDPLDRRPGLLFVAPHQLLDAPRGEIGLCDDGLERHDIRPERELPAEFGGQLLIRNREVDTIIIVGGRRHSSVETSEISSPGGRLSSLSNASPPDCFPVIS